MHLYDYIIHLIFLYILTILISYSINNFIKCAVKLKTSQPTISL